MSLIQIMYQDCNIAVYLQIRVGMVVHYHKTNNAYFTFLGENYILIQKFGFGVTYYPD